MNKVLRLLLIGAALACLIAGLIFLYRGLTCVSYVKKAFPVYTYRQEAKVDYRVYFKPNELYQGNSLGAGKVYVSNFVDYINSFFTYRFTGDQEAVFHGSYQVTGIMEALTTREKQNKCLWQREFILQPRTPFAGNGKEMAIQQVVPIRFSEYYDFAKRVNREAELAPDEIRLTVKWAVAIEAVTGRGTVREYLTPTMVIPVGSRAFEIGGQLLKIEPGALQITRKVPAGTGRGTLINAGILTGASLLLLILLLVFTEGVKKTETPLQKEIRQILKKYGERIALVDGEIKIDDGLIAVKSMEDLVRIADELSKPVIYRPVVSAAQVPVFYVLDKTGAYVYRLPQAATAEPVVAGREPLRQENITTM
ncbi:DUF5305 family protein [Desulfofundulus sp.]|uniref:DUF5305 family protein n=1 Tax=Desulfofundulus sp. TaxID=2282750 RepID=UPI003C712D37